jgi:hypothetical protein
VDDFHQHHDAGLTREQAQRQLDSVLKLLDYLGFEYKPSKTINVTRQCEYVGFVIDSEEGAVGITATRAASLRAAIADFRVQHGAARKAKDGKAARMSRRAVAQIIGKLQYVTRVVTGGQLHLQEGYAARDAFSDPETELNPSMRARWATSVDVDVGAAMLKELDFWDAELETLPSRPVYLKNVGAPSGFWTGVIAEDDEALDADGAFGISAEDIEVLTGDASGTMGGGWWRHERMAFRFQPEECAPIVSSNYRELKTAVAMLQRWGPRLRGRRVLIRTDNSTTASVVNSMSTQAPALQDLARDLYDVCREYGIIVSARHIAGLKNGLADRLSRLVRFASKAETDYGDWRFRHDEFEFLQAVIGRAFDIVACADALGENAHCERYCSHVDSVLERNLEGATVWANADWELLDELLPHFRKGYAAAPHDTAGVFIVPFWPQMAWWRHLRGFRVLAHYPKGTELFTAPGHSDGFLSDSDQSEPPPRRYCGTTNWPTVALYCPPAARTLHARSAGGALRGSGRRGGADDGAGAGETRLELRWAELSGIRERDLELVRALPARAVPRMRRADF